jgi:hypothetical protein
MKKSFTLSREAVAYVVETRRKRRAGSDSEALDLLIRDAMLDAKRREIDAAYKEYYDTASEEDLAEQRVWAENVGPNMFTDIDAAEAQS